MTIRGVDADAISLLKFTVEDLETERIEDFSLDDSSQRSSAVSGIIAFLDQESFGVIGELQANLSVAKALEEPLELEVDNLGDLPIIQTVEDDDLIDAIEKLGTEMRANASVTRRSRSSFGRSSMMYWLPMFDVMMITVFLKSTVRPWPSVMRPSSSTWSKTLKTSLCAFSISSKSTTE